MALPLLCFSQQGKVLHGQIFYQEDQKPVPNALVSITNAPDYHTMTDTKGEFIFNITSDTTLPSLLKILITLPDNESFEFDTDKPNSFLKIPVPRKFSASITEVTHSNIIPEDTTTIIPKHHEETPKLTSPGKENKTNTEGLSDNSKKNIIQSSDNQADMGSNITQGPDANEDLTPLTEDISDIRRDFEEITKKIELESQNIIKGSESIKKDVLRLWNRLKQKRNLSNAQRDTIRDFIKNLDNKIKEYSEANQSSQNNVISSLKDIKQLLDVQENQIRINRITIITLISIIFGLSLLSYIFYIINKRTQKQKEVLAQNYQKINQQKEEINQQKEEIQIQKDSISKKNKELEFAYTRIKDSVQYAERIQNAFLVNPQRLEYHFKDSFIFHVPKDIVSGDFYWHSYKDDLLLLAVIDCTGHGVPGALMTIMANDALNQIVNEKNILEPARILEELDNRVKSALGHKMMNEGEAQDGMDLMVAQFDFRNQQVTVSGAGSTLYFVRGRQIHQFKGSKFIIGRLQNNEPKVFHEEVIDLRGGEIIYLFSDGFQDQFGGDDDSKYLKTKFRDLLLEVSTKPLDQQYQRLQEEFERWKGDKPQTDDVLVLGLKL